MAKNIVPLTRNPSKSLKMDFSKKILKFCRPRLEGNYPLPAITLRGAFTDVRT